MNISGTLNFFRLFRDPSLCLPHYTISQFSHLPIPLPSLANQHPENQKFDIKAIVLDKDNCFTESNNNTVYKPYKEKFQELRKAYPGRRLLIVSNSAGTLSDGDCEQATLLERETGVEVLRHNVKKPGCREAILDYFNKAPECKITAPAEIAVIGDRILTDVMMANQMGSHAFWIKDGIPGENSVVSSLEKLVVNLVYRRGYCAPSPQSIFE